MTEETTTQPGLFDVGEAVRAGKPGRVEAALRRSLERGVADGTVTELDEALGEAALVQARALDTADLVGGLKGGYLAAQAGPVLQRMLHALRLPAELTAVAPPLPTGETGAMEDWWRDVGDALGPG